MEIKPAIIVIADISGYTAFIHQYQKSLLHAETLITELMNAVIKASKHPLIVNKLEGDAVLFIGVLDSPDQAVTASMEIVKQAEDFFNQFKVKQQQLLASTICDCDACSNLEKLRLKIILHVGEILIKKIQQFEEVAGKDVIIAHRLLKNSINTHEYLLMTDDFFKKCNGWQGKQPEYAKEHVDDVGDVDIVFYPLETVAYTPSKQNKLQAMLNLANLEWNRLLRTLKLKSAKKFNHIPSQNQ